MNWDELKTHWPTARHDVRSRWNRIGEEEFEAIGGDRTRLAEQIQRAYGLSEPEAEQQIAEWEQSQRNRSFATERRSAQGDRRMGAPAATSGGGTKLHGDKLSQPGYIDDEARDAMRESTRPGETDPQTPEGAAPSQTNPDDVGRRTGRSRRRGA